MHFGDQRAWVQSAELRQQWIRVLRLRVGEQVSLFDDQAEYLYRLVEIKDNEVAIEKVTELQRQTAPRPLLLAWALLKRDKNDWVLQKATEIGVTHFVPVIAERSEKTGLDIGRSKRIIIEAVEQCGRADVPRIDEPQSLQEVIGEYRQHYDLMVAHQGGQRQLAAGQLPAGVLIGPEGGWSQAELALFEEQKLPVLSVGNFVLRAETAAIIAADHLSAGAS